MALSKQTLVHMFETMNRIRMFEQKLQEFFAAGEIPGFVHLYLGEEAVATGACAALTDKDMITSTHRGHGHLLAKGGDLKLMMAEIFGRQTGYCKGKGGSMHIADLDLGILGANGIVGGGGPLAVGAALAAKYKKTDHVALCFFGDGASNQGTTQESLNMASAWKLPLVFVNENNGYGISCPQCKSMAVVDIADRAAAYDMPGVVVDGNDVLAVFEAVTEAVKRARKGEGPSLVECKTYRWRGHFEGDACTYRCVDELEEWMAKDPLPRFESKLLESKTLSEKEVESIKARIGQEVEEAVRYAQESPLPPTSALMDDVYA
ncbi:pyruvate dehydrogenase (acetyl-transferring) E1 component subunit alpha [Oceanidesulfovibrio indonesiensis]|uniref:Pyruvate dehydrogenase (Acetyl-transferring) E1 component subunit alpha n=1 Tax=Oceanidesulfovibrio indonesiensis TaxID=54767 RepID=A0A7M3MDZ0_9BACT|nr:thiamine pyrophosphate-dependent dehydrogenase E1 component subunit alpha [Oceanidesulfovibrio indonesiensis]TVM16915.1 pyruvate dehydrogenase (acetyl-transferring) E1 component subunit alpha [Oceanidesulfovibrio indonesiensis]